MARKERARTNTAEDSGTTGVAMQSGAHPTIAVFEYLPFPEPSPPAWISLAKSETTADAVVPMRLASVAPDPIIDESACARFEQKIAEEARRSFEEGRQQGLREGHQAEREALNAALSTEEKRRTEQLAALIHTFADERDRYLHAVEHEVVELALAIAARILRREAQMDPLLLTGAVRVALGQLSNTSQVRLRVPEAELGLWTEAIEHVPNITVKPTVLAGEGMRLGDCVIATELGSVDLGVRAQLSEIERGFFDRPDRTGIEATTVSSVQAPDQKAGR
jgi:flagellar assembly protein FliH